MGMPSSHWGASLESRAEELAACLCQPVNILGCSLSAGKHRSQYPAWSTQGWCPVLPSAIADRVSPVTWLGSKERSGTMKARSTSPRCGSGQCSVTVNRINKNRFSVTFSVDHVTHAVDTYCSAANHDPDGDSMGTTITVFKP
jgi:hypothetical protein